MARGRRDNDTMMERMNARRARKDRSALEKYDRFNGCLAEFGGQTYPLNLDETNINNVLCKNCSDVEQQMIALRRELQLKNGDIEYRIRFTKSLLSCLYRHHEILYQGILFGSTVNGLGHRDSDVDLRLRPIARAPDSNGNSDLYEPISMNEDFIDRILRNIAFRTTVCSQAQGEFVPSKRCPIAKLKFFASTDPTRRKTQEGLSFDISLSPFGSLGSFNSRFLRFLCKLEPKFHILALTLRHWSKTQNLIQAGLFSSYALINMLIFFCQSTSPPLLPTVDMMREMYFEHDDRNDSNNNHKTDFNGLGANSSPQTQRALTQVESQCLVCLHEDRYIKSDNRDPLSLLLLKFFEFYLKFPYSTHIITIRPGRALTKQEFQKTTQFNPRFPIKSYLNIQDPFDMKHNLTSGMDANHFFRIMTTIVRSYETLYEEVLNDLSKSELQRGRGYNERKASKEQSREDLLREIAKGFKRLKYRLYTQEPLDKREVQRFLQVCTPHCERSNEFKKIHDIVSRPGEEMSTADNGAVKRNIKILLRDVRRTVQEESMWGLTSIFTPLVPEVIKLPRLQPEKGKTDEKNDVPTTSKDSNNTNKL